jgi:orotidine-5'-phosphate decarboxylase
MTHLLKYSDRIKFHSNPTAIRLLEIMDRKSTNLCVSLDMTTCTEVLALADSLGPLVCCVKTHVDILTDFTPSFVQALLELQKVHDFIIFEDRKFADIGSTVEKQYSQGIYKIAEWSDITNCHTVPGEGIISGLKKVGLPLSRGLLLLAEMSSKGSLAVGEYTKQTIEMAHRHPDFVIGFIGQNRVESDRDFLYLTPGVSVESKGDGLGQQYRSPHDVIVDCGCDVIIVGRSIIQGDAVANAHKYRKAGWDAYMERLSK